MMRSIHARAPFVLLSLSLACSVWAQEPVTPELPPAEKRTVAAPVESKEAPSPVKPGPSTAGPLSLDATAIRGNQELPKVLYIVPWKDPAMAELAGRPFNSLVEEVLAPVDREVFRRQTRYFSQLYGAKKPAGGDPPVGAQGNVTTN
jgi:hypothetical protein